MGNVLSVLTYYILTSMFHLNGENEAQSWLSPLPAIIQLVTGRTGLFPRNARVKEWAHERASHWPQFTDLEQRGNGMSGEKQNLSKGGNEHSGVKGGEQGREKIRF